MSPDIVICIEMKWRMDVSDISFFYGSRSDAVMRKHVFA